MKRSRNGRRIVTLVLLAAASAWRCTLDDDAGKHRCVTDDDCLGDRQCVTGYCRDDLPEVGGSAGSPEGGAGGEPGASGDGGRATGGSVPGGSSGDTGQSGGSDARGGMSGRGGSGGGAGTGEAGAGEAGAGASNGCPAMVRLPEDFCIDSTEVTRLAYQAWLNTFPPIPHPQGCQTNTSLQPNCEWYDFGARPATCVDWCDADAYCHAVGKRLCGRIGGGPTNYDTGYDDAEQSEWFAACSAGGARDYPYGEVWTVNACADNGTLLATASAVSCQGPRPYNCVFDLSGNAWEWEDSCSDDTEAASCRLRGGAYYLSGGPAFACAADASERRTGAAEYNAIGFRCCSDSCP